MINLLIFRKSKKLKKGKYTVKIKVAASGDNDHLPAAKTAKVTVRVM